MKMRSIPIVSSVILNGIFFLFVRFLAGNSIPLYYLFLAGGGFFMGGSYNLISGAKSTDLVLLYE